MALSIILTHCPHYPANPQILHYKYHHPVWYGKTRMVWLLDGEKFSKISLFVLTQSTNVTDTHTHTHTHTPRQTGTQKPHDDIGRAYASASKNWPGYLQNGWKYGHDYYGRRIGNRIQAFKWYHFQWPWVISNPHFKVTIIFNAN